MAYGPRIPLLPPRVWEKINVRRHKPRRKVSKPRHGLEQCFLLFSFGLGDTADLSGRKLRMGGTLQIQLERTTHTHATMGFCSREGLSTCLNHVFVC